MPKIEDMVTKFYNSDNEIPAWAEEVIEEIRKLRRELHSVLKKHNDIQKRRSLNRLRRALCASPHSYYLIRYGSEVYSVDKDGMLYNRRLQKAVSSKYAYEILEFLHEHKESISSFVELRKNEV